MSITKSWTSIEHLENITSNIESLISKEMDFNAFISIALGVEYLGSFLDDKEFTDYKQSFTRFKNGLDFFKNSWYKNNKEFLFKQFRGTLVHQYRNGSSLILTSNCVHNAPLSDHLKKTENGIIVLIVEQLYIDFKEACLRFRNTLMKEHSYNTDKLNLDYVQIISYKSKTDNISYEATASLFGNNGELL